MENNNDIVSNFFDELDKDGVTKKIIHKLFFYLTNKFKPYIYLHILTQLTVIILLLIIIFILRKNNSNTL